MRKLNFSQNKFLPELNFPFWLNIQFTAFTMSQILTAWYADTIILNGLYLNALQSEAILSYLIFYKGKGIFVVITALLN